jgi:hypothetical protein
MKWREYMDGEIHTFMYKNLLEDISEVFNIKYLFILKMITEWMEMGRLL